MKLSRNARRLYAAVIYAAAGSGLVGLHGDGCVSLVAPRVHRFDSDALAITRIFQQILEGLAGLGTASGRADG